jgi:hypothetical protein
MTEAATASTPSQGTSEAPAASETVENQAQANETPAQAERRKLKAKINGKETEVYEDDVLRDYQKYASADEKLREAAQKRKDIERFYEQLEKDPESLLNDPRLPINKQELAMKWLTEQIEQEVKYSDPKDRELDEIRRELEQFKNRDKEAEETKQQQEHRQLVEQRREAIATTLSEAMALSPLSKDPEIAAATLRDMAMHMRLCKEAGYDITPQELAQHVEKKNLGSMRALATKLKGEDLINFFGEEVVTEIRRADLSRIKKAREIPPAQTAEHWENKKAQVRQLYDPSELRSR